MINSKTSSVTAKLLVNKLGLIVQRLQEKASPEGINTSLSTYEDVLSESIKGLNEFYRSISSPGFGGWIPFADSEPSPAEYNTVFTQISDDLTILFNEFENVEQVMLGNFNYITSRLNRLQGKTKQVSSLLADYILYSQYATKDAVFFGDTFVSTNRIDTNSSLLNSDLCEINQVEGIVTLPIDRAKQKKIIIKELPVINSSSNGTPGNSSEIGKEFNGDIAVILDGNADTWFEYERVVAADDNIPLVLDFTIILSKPEVINFIRINPNNFGTRTQINILNIDTSIDGKEFVSVKDDIPIADWTVEDEENIFVLAPSTSKYAGQGLFTFTPRKAKYIRLLLNQTTPYIINTTDGGKFRYAIGLRDVHIEAQPYKTNGEIVSTKYVSLDEVKKLVLLSNQNPSPDFDSSLASIEHFVSPDDGVSWHQIRPIESSGEANATQTVPELLNFNTIDTSAISTQVPVYSLRYKAKLKRNTESFKEGNSDLAQIKDWTSELHKPPTTTPFSIILSNPPIDGTVQVIDPGFGSRGKNDVSFTVIAGTNTSGIFTLPFNSIPRVYSKTYDSAWRLVESGDEEVTVNGIPWTRGYPPDGSGTDLLYSIDYENKTLQFGDGTAGAAVSTGALIALKFGEERIYPSSSSGHTAILQYPTVKDQKEVEVYLVKPDERTTKSLKRGLKIHRVDPYLSTTATISFSDTSVFATLQTFKNGNSELTSTGHYSIDYTNGIIYSYDRTSSATDTTVTYTYSPRIKLSDSEWGFAEEQPDSTQINISNWWTNNVTSEAVQTSVKYFNLSKLSIVQGTLTFSGSTSGILDKEVPFIDGKIELAGVIKTTEQIDTITVGAPGNYSFTLNLGITTDTSFAVFFSNTSVFTTYVGGVPSSPGEYSINRATRTVTVNVSASVDSPGTVTYYYANPNAVLTGRYSVNYETGEVYTYVTTGAGIVANYQYTDYRVKYPISRKISSEDWSLDKVNKKLSFKDREILLGQRTLQLTATGAREKYYQVVYQYVKSTREDVSELEPYFSPILKDYALKVITAGRLL